jgi:outer membrane murein-binding lipoprotein Lpp
MTTLSRGLVMSFRVRAAVLVALIFLAAGCASQPDPGPLNAATSQLADAQEEIDRLKSEVLVTKSQLHEAQRKIAEAETRTFNTTKAQHDDLREEEHAFALLESAERTKVLQVLEKAKRGEPLTAQMVKVLDDAHVGSKYVKKFLNENLSDAERAALKGAD